MTSRSAWHRRAACAIISPTALPLPWNIGDAHFVRMRDEAFRDGRVVPCTPTVRTGLDVHARERRAAARREVARVGDGVMPVERIAHENQDIAHRSPPQITLAAVLSKFPAAAAKSFALSLA
jgi:hypothetical protein